jgi:putative oxidoreductase
VKLKRDHEVAYALMRFMAGTMFAFHGSQKLLGWPGDKEPVEFASLRWFAGVIELLGGPMIALGVFGSAAAFIASGMMAVAYFKAHAGDGFNPIINRGELAVLYCFVFLYIAARGSGPFSIDALWRRKGGGST